MFLNRFFKKRDATRADLYRKIAISFFSISVCIAIVIFAISFSWATVTITPVVKQMTDTVAVTIQEEPVSIVGALSGKIIVQELEAAGTFTPTAVSTIQEKATGTITVVNSSSRTQPLRATTRFLSAQNVLFRSTGFVIVPANGQIEVSVIADVAGDPGDLRAERFTLPGLNPDAQKQIYGISFSAGAGGAREVRAVTDADIASAEAEVQKKLQEKFALILDTEKTKVSAPAVASATRSEIVSRMVDRAVGEQAKEFTLKLTVRFTAVLYDEQKFIAALRQSLLQNLSTGYQLIDPVASDIQSTITQVDPASHSAIISSSVTAGKIRTDDLQPYHKKDLVGLSQDDITAYFTGYDDISNVSVAFYPFWVKRAPLLLDHITIQIQKER
ncbi:MAG: hypothetical protein Q8P56_02895 [Candidatus Uhrbacteria bacterium]|nr:hypothetical protein [Candidatus Uhrbacteria bacterium]